MKKFAFSDFEAYAEAIPSLMGRVRLVAREQRGWALDVADAGGLVLVGGQSGAAGLYEGAYHADVFGIYAPSAGSQTTVNGQPVHDGMFALLPPGAEVHVRSRAPGRYLGLDVPREEMLQRMQREGIDPKVLEGGAMVIQRPNPLVQLAGATLDGLQRGETTGTGSAGQHLRECLLLAVADALPKRAPPAALGRPVTRGRVLRRAMLHIEECLQTGVPLTGLAQALHVSQRTLNRAFVESVGMSAQAYIRMSRLHAIRGALLAARPGETVTGVAARYNVWDTGRMAGEYRRLFGLHPSEQLNRAVSVK